MRTERELISASGPALLSKHMALASCCSSRRVCFPGLPEVVRGDHRAIILPPSPPLPPPQPWRLAVSRVANRSGSSHGAVFVPRRQPLVHTCDAKTTS